MKTLPLSLIKNFFFIDFKIHKKYPSRIFFAFFQLSLMIGLFFYISETLGEIALLKSKYFPFVASGLAFQHFFSGIVNSASEKLEEYRDYGVLEEILFSRFSPWIIMLFSGFYDIGMSIFKASIILLAITYVFNFSISPLFLIGTMMVSFLLALNLSFVASCSFLIWKRFSLLELGGSVLTLFLSGIYFPVDVLPRPIEMLAHANPLLHGLYLFRLSLGFEIEGYENFNPLLSFVVLITAVIAVSVFNLFLYSKTIKKVKDEGLASQF